MSTDLASRIWFNTDQASEYALCSRQTIVRALQSSELRGAQRKKKGHWRIHRDWLDAWMRGEAA